MSRNTNSPVLTQLQQDFVCNYVSNGFNAYNAAIKAGYSVATAEHVKQNIITPKITQRIEQAISRVDNRMLTALHLSIEHRLKALSKIIYDILPEDGQPRRRYYKVAISAIAEVSKMTGD